MKPIKQNIMEEIEKDLLSAKELCTEDEYEELIESGEISSSEAGFMRGWHDAR